MSSTTSTTNRHITTLRIIRLLSNTIIPFIVLILFVIYNICISVYTFHYNQPVPKSAVIANLSLILTFIFFGRVGNLIVNIWEDIDNASSGEVDVESGRVEVVAGRIWEHLESHLNDMSWASRESPRRHTASLDSPHSPPWPPRSKLKITNPDNDLISPTEAEPQGLARNRAYTERDLSSHPKKVSRHPVVPIKAYIPFRPPRPRTPSPPRPLGREKPHVEHYRAGRGNHAPEPKNESFCFDGFGDKAKAFAPTQSHYQQPNQLPKHQHPHSQYAFKGTKTFADIVPPDKLSGHHNEQNDIQAYHAKLPPQPQIDYPPRYEKEPYPWREPDYHKSRLYDEARQRPKYEECKRDLDKSRGWREDDVPPRVREILTAQYGERKRHRASDAMSDASSDGEKCWDFIKRWDMAIEDAVRQGQYRTPSPARTRGRDERRRSVSSLLGDDPRRWDARSQFPPRSPSVSRGRRRGRVVRRTFGSPSYSDLSPGQRRVSPRFPAHWDTRAQRDNGNVQRATEPARRPVLTARKPQGFDRIPYAYLKYDQYERPMVAEVSPRTSVFAAGGETREDRRATEFERLAKRCKSM